MKESLLWSRREVFRQAVAGTATMLVAGVSASKLHAAELPQVSEDDPLAKGVKYMHDATKSERPDASQFCHNCRYSKGTANAAWVPCEIFAGKAVNSNGWCNVWAKKG